MLMSLCHLVSITTATVSPFTTLQISEMENMTRIIFNHPPINLVDQYLVSDLYNFLWSPQPSNRTSPPPKVVVFESANPEYFLAHIDLTAVQPPQTELKSILSERYFGIGQLLRTITSAIFIAEIDGRAFGAGHELAVQMDMRFTGPKTAVGSFENGLGLVAGAGGQLFLGALLSRGLALEYLLSAKTFDGPRGKRLGLLNDYFEQSKDLKAYVDDLAARVALFPAAGLNQTKSALFAQNPTASQLSADGQAFLELAQTPVVQKKSLRISEDKL